MKETYPKYIVNAVVIVLVTITIAITFTMNSSTRDKRDCYKKVYAGALIKWKEDYKTKDEIESRAAESAIYNCYKK